ncbi:DUF4097 family beta strand repeat-containing protein [Virgibacillus litoralis]|uniref:DUF4097 and DUF4098 domain-containing protein YvlB n=1 Tax=Virgibacillus litoralis TaxID=578221 RepID=A0ABS4HCF7_9BACI|nr:DUF4097 family beta strand repeat-containing protein [Virgibacillus litoralis]MBP1948597.1 DUF4097 and DUF4098 domain-containing protein YvlB [Virgibacillus litoralis]
MKEGKTVGKVIDSVIHGGRKAVYKEVITQKDTIDNVAKLKELNISTSEASVNISTHKDKRVDLLLETYEGGPELIIDHFEDSLNISAKGSKTYKSFNTPPCMLHIVVPSEISGNWSIISCSGDVSAGNLISDSFDIRTSSGELNLANLEAQKLHLKTSSGKITASDIDVSETYFETSSGEAAFYGIKGDFNGSTSSGDVTVMNFQGENFHVVTSSGKIQHSNGIVEDMSLNTSSGNIQADSLKGEKVVLHANSGDIKCTRFTGDAKGYTISGDILLSLLDESSLDIESFSGDITLLAGKVNLNATVQVSTGSGDIFNKLSLMSVKKHLDNQLEGVVGEGANPISLKAGSGDVIIS